MAQSLSSGSLGTMSDLQAVTPSTTYNDKVGGPLPSAAGLLLLRQTADYWGRRGFRGKA